MENAVGFLKHEATVVVVCLEGDGHLVKRNLTKDNSLLLLFQVHF